MTPNESSSPTARRDWLASILLQRQGRLMPRLLSAYTSLAGLGRNARRRLSAGIGDHRRRDSRHPTTDHSHRPSSRDGSRVGRRRAGARLAGVALLLALSAGPLLTPRAQAAAITVTAANGAVVDDSLCSLGEAIRNANDNTDGLVDDDCAAGTPNGADTITLTGDVTLTTSYDYFYFSDTGLPLVTTTITIEGDGHTISRDGGAVDFRLLAVSSSGNLTLNDVTLSGGRSQDRGGAIYSYDNAVVALTDSIVSDNYADAEGGGILNAHGTLTITASAISGNDARSNGGGIYSDDEEATTTITRSTISDNTSTSAGGGLYNDFGTMTVIDSVIAGNTANSGEGGGIQSFDGTLTVTGSTISGNHAANGGGIYSDNRAVTTVTNSTISGNSVSSNGGGLYNDIGSMVTVTNATITGNTAGDGGGIYNWTSSTLTLVRSIVSGNSATGSGDEVYLQPDTLYTADAHNVFGYSGLTNADAFAGFTPGASDVTATSDGSTPTSLAAILDTTLADNGGPTETHNLVANSPAVDIAPDAACAAPPTAGVDQRGLPRPFDGDGSPSANECDAGAVEFGSSLPSGAADVYVSAVSAGTTGDGVPFGPHDILKWTESDGWSKWFDGTAAGLMPSGRAAHNVNAVWIPDPAGDDVVLSFVQNGRVVPSVPGKVNGMDLVWWDGSSFSLWFDGEDVGLTNKTKEKIDALHVLDGAQSPIGAGCLAYLLISTQGDGQVPNYGGGTLKFDGTDVLGFCMTNAGANTAGFWHRVLNGKAEGMPGQALTSLSASDDGQTLYLTTKSTFNVDSATGGPSMVYKYEFATGEFSGPFFSAPAEGLPGQVDALHVAGELP